MRITTLNQLVSAISKRQSVVCTNALCFSMPRPAAFMVNLPGFVLYKLMEGGMYTYKAKGKR